MARNDVPTTPGIDTKLSFQRKYSVQPSGLTEGGTEEQFRRTLKNKVFYTDHPKHPQLKNDRIRDNDEKLLYARCIVVDGGTKMGDPIKVVDEGSPNSDTFLIKRDDLYEMNDPTADVMVMHEVGDLPYKNPPCVLHFLEQRLINKEIYTSCDPLVIALNPYKDLGNATDEVIHKYKEGKTSKLRPHVFRLAKLAIENLVGAGRSQTIMVSGESGAGKTEATKQIMRYASMGEKGSLADGGEIQAAIMAANPVLEAFGNAKTLRNNNSSRFGRFMQLNVKPTGGFKYGSVENFLLEKSRIIWSPAADRNYHIFYQILKGMTPSQKEEFGISGTFRTYHYLLDSESKEHATVKSDNADGIDDVEDFKEVSSSLRRILIAAGYGSTIEGTMVNVWKMLAAVLHLGNCKVESQSQRNGDDMAVLAKSDSLTKMCNCLGLCEVLISTQICVDKLKVGREFIDKALTPSSATINRDSVARSIYGEFFSWIVKKLNTSIEPPNGFGNVKFLALLDIFGFETFQRNSLEQLFINITNERLQATFIDVVFSKNIQLYRDEGIRAPTIEWTDNSAVMRILCDKRNSVISLLSDSCLSATKKDSIFLSNLRKELSSDPKFPKCNEPHCFYVFHSIGAIKYDSDGFVSKNTDRLKASIVDLLSSSKNSIVAEMFNQVTPSGNARESLISYQFIGQLESLMKIIDRTEPHFVRCVKPNENKSQLTAVWGKMQQQLVSLSIMDALALSQLGYSYKRNFEEFISQFKYLQLGIEQSKDSPIKKVQGLCRRAGLKMEKEDFAIGKTKVFLTQTSVEKLSFECQQVFAKWTPLATMLEAAYRRKKNEILLKPLEAKATRIQAQIRLKLAEIRS